MAELRGLRLESYKTQSIGEVVEYLDKIWIKKVRWLKKLAWCGSDLTGLGTIWTIYICGIP